MRIAVEVSDRTDNVTRAFQRIHLERTAQEANVAAMRDAANSVGNTFERNTPDGSVWEEESWDAPWGVIAHGRPSIRLFGTVMAGGWRPIVDVEPDGVTLKVYSEAPHAIMQMMGTQENNPDGYRIPHEGSRKLLAWFRLMDFEDSDAMPKPTFRTVVHHPGYPPNKKLVNAAKQSTRQIKTSSTKSVRDAYFGSIRKALGG